MLLYGDWLRFSGSWFRRFSGWFRWIPVDCGGFRLIAVFRQTGFRFIHGFYTSISILNILKGSLQPKLKGSNVWWPFNECGKFALGWVYHTWSLYRYCKEKIDQTQLQWYIGQFLRAPAGPVFRLDRNHSRWRKKSGSLRWLTFAMADRNHRGPGPGPRGRGPWTRGLVDPGPTGPGASWPWTAVCIDTVHIETQPYLAVKFS